MATKRKPRLTPKVDLPKFAAGGFWDKLKDGALSFGKGALSAIPGVDSVMDAFKPEVSMDPYAPKPKEDYDGQYKLQAAAQGIGNIGGKLGLAALTAGVGGAAAAGAVGKLSKIGSVAGQVAGAVNTDTPNVGAPTPTKIKSQFGDNLGGFANGGLLTIGNPELKQLMYAYGGTALGNSGSADSFLHSEKGLVEYRKLGKNGKKKRIKYDEGGKVALTSLPDYQGYENPEYLPLVGKAIKYGAKASYIGLANEALTGDTSDSQREWQNSKFQNEMNYRQNGAGVPSLTKNLLQGAYNDKITKGKELIRSGQKYNMAQNMQNTLTNTRGYAAGGRPINPNAEVDGGEILLPPAGKQIKGNTKSINKGIELAIGKRHEQGGVKIKAPIGTKILSDRLTLPNSNTTYAAAARGESREEALNLYNTQENMKKSKLNILEQFAGGGVYKLDYKRKMNKPFYDKIMAKNTPLLNDAGSPIYGGADRDQIRAQVKKRLFNIDTEELSKKGSKKFTPRPTPTPKVPFSKPPAGISSTYTPTSSPSPTTLKPKVSKLGKLGRFGALAAAAGIGIELLDKYGVQSDKVADDNIPKGAIIKSSYNPSVRRLAEYASGFQKRAAEKSSIDAFKAEQEEQYGKPVNNKAVQLAPVTVTANKSNTLPTKETFGEAFKKGRAAALAGETKIFEWNGKKYTTELVSEKPKNSSYKDIPVDRTPIPAKISPMMEEWEGNNEDNMYNPDPTMYATGGKLNKTMKKPKLNILEQFACGGGMQKYGTGGTIKKTIKEEPTLKWRDTSEANETRNMVENIQNPNEMLRQLGTAYNKRVGIEQRESTVEYPRPNTELKFKDYDPKKYTTRVEDRSFIIPKYSKKVEENSSIPYKAKKIQPQKITAKVDNTKVEDRAYLPDGKAYKYIPMNHPKDLPLDQVVENQKTDRELRDIEYAKARKAGKKDFDFKGKKYTTEYADNVTTPPKSKPIVDNRKPKPAWENENIKTDPRYRGNVLNPNSNKEYKKTKQYAVGGSVEGEPYTVSQVKMALSPQEYKMYQEGNPQVKERFHQRMQQEDRKNTGAQFKGDTGYKKKNGTETVTPFSPQVYDRSEGDAGKFGNVIPEQIKDAKANGWTPKPANYKWTYDKGYALPEGVTEEEAQAALQYGEQFAPELYDRYNRMGRDAKGNLSDAVKVNNNYLQDTRFGPRHKAILEEILPKYRAYKNNLEYKVPPVEFETTIEEDRSGWKPMEKLPSKPANLIPENKMVYPRGNPSPLPGPTFPEPIKPQETPTPVKPGETPIPITPTATPQETPIPKSGKDWTNLGIVGPAMGAIVGGIGAFGKLPVRKAQNIQNTVNPYESSILNSLSGKLGYNREPIQIANNAAVRSMEMSGLSGNARSAALLNTYDANRRSQSDHMRDIDKENLNMERDKASMMQNLGAQRVQNKYTAGVQNNVYQKENRALEDGDKAAKRTYTENFLKRDIPNVTEWIKNADAADRDNKTKYAYAQSNPNYKFSDTYDQFRRNGISKIEFQGGKNTEPTKTAAGTMVTTTPTAFTQDSSNEETPVTGLQRDGVNPFNPFGNYNANGGVIKKFIKSKMKKK